MAPRIDKFNAGTAARVVKQQEQATNAAISLLKRLPPQHLGKNIDALTQMVPFLEKSLAPYISKPLELKLDPEVNKYFIACDFNFHDGSHRSPWTDSYLPDPGDKDKNAALYRPNARLRQFEVQFNEVFDAYKTCYYEGGVSSVYIWDLSEGFAAVFLLRKEMCQRKGIHNGVWDAIHVAEVRDTLHTNVIEYKLTSTVLVYIEVGASTETSKMELSAMVTKQKDDKKKRSRDSSEDAHIVNIGKLIEDCEAAIQQQLDKIFLAKSSEVLHTVRALDPDELRERTGTGHGRSQRAQTAVA